MAMAMAMAMSEKKVPFIEPPEELRCHRNDGKSWRCHHWRIHKKSFCEEHYLSMRKQNTKKPEGIEENERAVPAKRLRKKPKRLREEEEGKAQRTERNNKKLKLRAERKCPKEEEEKDSEATVVLDRKVSVREKIKRLLQSIERDDGEEEEEAITRRRSSSSKSEKSSVPRSCHQCLRIDNRVVRCQNCNAKRFCVLCIKRWYPQMSEEAIAESCPYCRGNCNCKTCLCRKVSAMDSKNVGLPLNQDEKIQHLKHLVRSLYPFLEQFNHEQQLELEMEAKIRGLLLSDLELNQIVCSAYERIYCNNCKTSIIDFHRSCPNCSYDLCITCCREIRGSFLQEELVEQYIDASNDHVHTGEPLNLHSFKKESAEICLGSGSKNSGT